MHTISQRFICLLLGWLWLTGCAVNPVTGQQEMQLISEQEEIAMGQENYVPMQQQQGGSYETDPVLSAYVNSIGQKLVAVSDRKLPYEFVVLNNSVPNAWALPGGKIAVNRGLLVELNNEAELAAVLGHEIVHAAARHSAKKIETGMALNVGLIAIGIGTRDNQNSGAILAAGTVGTALLSQKYSRDAESEADYYGIIYMTRVGYDPQAAVSLQETFVRLANNKDASWLEGLFASHPPSQERVVKNRETAAKYTRHGLTLGEASFMKHIVALKKNKEAYAQYDKGREALKDKNYAQAMQYADAAIKAEPREALFDALKGDVYYVQNDYKTAKTHYDKAINKNGSFFYYYYRRGITHKQLGNKQNAISDLEKSYTLLPTKQAAQVLQALGVK